MKIDIDISEKYKEVNIIIRTKEVNKEIEQLINNIKLSSKKNIIGKLEEKIYILDLSEIYRFYGENKKIYTETKNGKFEIQNKLYELETDLNGTSFVRISKSAIVNFDKVYNMEMFFNGTMCVNFNNGKQEIVSRRYVPKIKQYLGIGGK